MAMRLEKGQQQLCGVSRGIVPNQEDKLSRKHFTDTGEPVFDFHGSLTWIKVVESFSSRVDDTS